MTAEQDKNIPLPDEFWRVAEKVVAEEGQLLMHAQILRRLKDDFPEADTLQLLQLERIATLYILIRAKEAKGTFAHDRAYKETTQLWHQMVADARKYKIKEDAAHAASENAVKAVSAALVKAIATLDIPEGVKSEILESVSVALEG